MMRNMTMVMAFLVGCGGGDPPPSYQQALAHYYAAGCSYFDTSTNPPTPIPESQEIGTCQNVAIAAPVSCRDELDGWLVCLDRVPGHAMNNADCDCSAEYMALLECR